MLWGEPLRETAEFMGQVRHAATAAGRSPPRFSLSTRPILAETDDKASCEKDIREAAAEQVASGHTPTPNTARTTAMNDRPRLATSITMGPIKV